MHMAEIIVNWQVEPIFRLMQLLQQLVRQKLREIVQQRNLRELTIPTMPIDAARLVQNREGTVFCKRGMMKHADLHLQVG